ncbi:MAG: hypothetical protein ABJZ55_13590 [Fuerstiella sp.]
MKQSSFIIACVLSSLSVWSIHASAEDRQGNYGASHEFSDRPIKAVDRTGGKLRELQRLHRTDYEVWVVNRATLQLQFKLHMQDRWGWSTHQTPDEYAWHSSDTLFESRKAASDVFWELQNRFGGYLDYEIEAILPRPTWRHVDTFHSEWEARMFLELILDAFPEFDGKIVEVNRPIPALQD